MSMTFDAVLADGVLKPTTPIDLPDGAQVHLAVLDYQVPDGPEMSVEEEMRFWDEWFAEPNPVSKEKWDEFARFLKENRFNIEERLDFSSGLERGVGSASASPGDPQKGLPRT